MKTRTRLGLVALSISAVALWLARPGAGERIGPCGDPEIHVRKSEATLTLSCDHVERRRFPVTFGKSPHGPKEKEGDERTPEGSYEIVSASRSARFDRFLLLSYPNREDRARSARSGVSSPGGAIGIHGTTRDVRIMARMWIRVAQVTSLSRLWGPTDGCIALINEDVEALADVAPVGTPVRISP